MGEPRDFFEFYDEDEAEEPYPGFGAADPESGPAKPDERGVVESARRRRASFPARGAALGVGAALAITVLLVATRDEPRRSAPGPEETTQVASPAVERADSPGAHAKEGKQRRASQTASNHDPGPGPPDRRRRNVRRERASGSAAESPPTYEVAASVSAPEATGSPSAEAPAPAEPVREATATDVVKAIGP